MSLRTAASLGRRTLASRALSGSCSGAPPPPCPPCERPPRPDCRATPPTRMRATRKVCCPPPSGHAPPCEPTDCTQTLTCSNRSKLLKKSPVPIATVGCGADRDGVALRLALAERERRLDYEHEVKTRAPPVAAAVPPAPYAPGVERECARATDGRDYALLAPCARAEPPPCGPDRTPPPDTCVELANDNKCTVQSTSHVDPCAHLPKTLIQIDRRPPQNTSPTAPVRNFTSRIMESLHLSRNTKTSCPRRSGDTKCETSGAKRAGDSGWCKTLPPPKQVPPSCREPTPTEKLKRHRPSRCSDKTPGKRAFHSSAIRLTNIPSSDSKPKTSQLSEAKSEVDALKKVLQQREGLKEAGRGRFVTGREAPGKPSKALTAGRMDIPVPVGVESVRVRVSLENACPVAANPCPNAHTDARSSACTNALSDVCPEVSPAAKPTAPLRCSDKATSEKQDSWLSIKSLVAACRKGEGPKSSKEVKDSNPTCPRPPRPSCPSSTPPPPCSRPAPSKMPKCPLPVPKPTAPLNPCKHQKSSPPLDPCKLKKSSLPSDPCQPKKPTRFLIYT